MDLKPGSHIHMMGICGTAMASLAGLLKDRGYKVTGSDLNPYPPMSTQLESLNIPILKPYKKENLNPKPDFVIVGNVISANNEEAQELIRLGIPYTSLPKAMGEFIIENRDCVCVSGTHGKTTTTSLMSWVLDQAGYNPGFMIGGIPKNFSQSFRNPKGNYFVIEGDEYDTAFFDKVPKFIHYKPKHVILTSIEFDHADIYKDLDAVKSAFSRLVKMIPRDGNLVCWGEDSNIRDLLEHTNTKNVHTYGFKNSSYIIEKINDNNGEKNAMTQKNIVFQIKKGSEVFGPFTTSMSGDYNVLNAAAVIIMSKILNVETESIKKSIQSFQGVKRRQEILGEPGGILVIEDFAHHPTAVRETLKGIARQYQGRKIFAVFEPRSATSRRKVFQKDYVDAFLNAEEILLAKAFDQTKINEEDRFSSDELVNDLRRKNKTAQSFESVDQIVSSLKMNAKKGDLILIMSNGGFDGIYQKLLTSLAH